MKKFMILMLSLAVLFSFAACDNSTSASGTTSGDIIGARVSGGGDKVYIPGETLNIDDYEFTLVLADGEERPASASDFVLDGEGVVSFVSTADNKAEMTASYKGTDIEVKLTYRVGVVTEIEVSGTADKTEYYAPISDKAKYRDDSIELDGITVNATVEDKDGNKSPATIDLENKYLFATMTNAITPDGGDAWSVEAKDAASKKVDNVVTVYFNGVKADGTVVTLESIDAKDTYDVTVIANLITKFELKTTDGFEVIKGSTEKGALDYVADPTAANARGVYVEATYQNTETAIVEEGDVKFSNDNGTTYGVADVASVTIPDSSFTLMGKVTLDGNGVEGLDAKVSKQITVAENSVVGIKASIAAGTLVMGDYTNTMPVGLVVNTVLRDGSTGTTALAYGTGYTVSRASGLDFRAQNGYEVGQNVTFTVTAVQGGYTDDVTVKLTTT